MDEHQIMDEQPKVVNYKKLYLRHLIVFSVLSVIIGIIVFFAGTRPSAETWFGLLADAFSLSGFLGLMWGLLMYVAAEGAFDSLSYGTKRVFKATFDKDYKKNMPQTFLEYKEMMKKKRKKPSIPYLVIASIFFVIGIVFILLFEFGPGPRI